MSKAEKCVYFKNQECMFIQTTGQEEPLPSLAQKKAEPDNNNPTGRFYCKAVFTLFPDTHRIGPIQKEGCDQYSNKLKGQ